MIKIPSEVLTAEELSEATGRDAGKIDIEITGISLDRQNLVLNIDTRLNFVMPMKLESLMKERIRSRIGSAGRIQNMTSRREQGSSGLKRSAIPTS